MFSTNCGLLELTRLIHTDFENNITSDNPGMDFNFDWLSPTLCIPEQSISNGDINVIELGNQESFMPFDFGGGAISNAIENLGQPNIISNIDDRADQAHSLRTTPALLMGADDSSSPAISINSSPSDYYWGYPPQAVDSDASSQCVRKLSQLSIDLYEHWKTIPPQTIHDPLSAENQAKWVSGASCKGFELDDTFRLTQAMIEIYPSFLSMFSSQRTEKTNEPIDHSSVLLILSCHLRLITVYEELFKHMQICINQKGRAKTLQQAMLNGPQLIIGTYIPPPSSAIPMQMLLFVQFATQLFDFAADLASQIKDPGAATPSSGSSSSASSSSGSPEDPTLALTRAAAENLKGRALSMSQQLSALRTQFLSAGILA